MTKMIQYIGNKPTKKDTVLKTNRIFERGEAVPVPDEEAVRYLRHKDVFRDVTDLLDDDDNPPELPPIPDPRRQAVRQSSHEAATERELRAENEQLQAKVEEQATEIQSLEAQLAAYQQAPNSGDPNAGGEGKDAPQDEPQDWDVRQEKIITAIGELDRDSDFTAQNKPKTDAIEKAVGWRVSGEERDAAWKAIVDAANEAE